MFPPWFFKDEEAVTEAASEALLGTLDYVLLVKQKTKYYNSNFGDTVLCELSMYV